MKKTFWFLFLIFPLVWQCASPARPASAPDTGDDYRLVSREAFIQEPGWAPAGSVEKWIQKDKSVVFFMKAGRTASITFLSPQVFRFWYHTNPTQGPYTTAVTKQTLVPTDLRVSDDGHQVILETPALRLTVQKKDLTWEVDRDDSLMLKTAAPLAWYRGRVVQSFDFSSQEHLWGLGISGTGLDKKGQNVKFWNDRPGNTDETAAFSAPFLLAGEGDRNFALYLDNSYQSYVNLKNEGSYLGVLNGGFDLYFIAGKSPKEVVQTTSELLGKPDLPPLGALNVQAEGGNLSGPWTSILMGRGSWEMNSSLTPDPGVGWGKTGRQQGFFTSDIPDFTRPETRSWWAQTAPLPSDVHSAWALGEVLPSGPWTTRFWDQGQGSLLAKVHNIYPLEAAKAAHEAQALKAPSVRPWVTLKTGFSGLAPLGILTLGLGTDPSQTLGQILSAGLGGQPTVQVEFDLDKLLPGNEPAWQTLALGALNPYLTLKSHDFSAWWASLDQDGQKRFQNIMALHASFKPFFYALARKASQDGLPLLRPLFLSYPKDEKARNIQDEFLLGDQMLAAPALHGESSRTVYLPTPGIWFDWYTGQEITSGQEVTVTLQKGRVPLFVHGGSMIPVREPEYNVASDVFSPVTVHIYPAGSGTLSLYQDDGVSLAYQKGVFRETTVVYTANNQQMFLQQQAVNNSTALKKPDPYTLFRLHNVYRPREVRVDQRPVPLYGDSFGVTDTDRNAAWYEHDTTLLIKLFRPEASQNVDINF